jgi:hypothetical protein
VVTEKDVMQVIAIFERRKSICSDVKKRKFVGISERSAMIISERFFLKQLQIDLHVSDNLLVSDVL